MEGELESECGMSWRVSGRVSVEGELEGELEGECGMSWRVSWRVSVG